MKLQSSSELKSAPLLVGEAALPTVGEDPVDDGLPDAVEQAPDVGGEHQRLVVLVSDCTHNERRGQRRHRTCRSCVERATTRCSQELTFFYQVTVQRNIETRLRVS